MPLLMFSLCCLYADTIFFPDVLALMPMMLPADIGRFFH